MLSVMLNPLLGFARDCPGSSYISPVWLERCSIGLSHGGHHGDLVSLGGSGAGFEHGAGILADGAVACIKAVLRTLARRCQELATYQMDSGIGAG